VPAIVTFDPACTVVVLARSSGKGGGWELPGAILSDVLEVRGTLRPPRGDSLVIAPTYITTRETFADGQSRILRRAATEILADLLVIPCHTGVRVSSTPRQGMSAGTQLGIIFIIVVIASVYNYTHTHY